ncbi:MAG: T9SS type A sorting domain-containing protein, partial [Bacteroidota bacterium]
RVHNTTAWYKASENPSILLVANDLSGQTAQESIIRFTNEATTGFDPAFDSHFLAGYAPLFYSVAGNERLSTNALPESGGTVQIPFEFVKNDGSSFTIEAKTISNINGAVILNDLKTGASQDLTLAPVYNFTSAEGDNAKRFLLTFSHVGIGENAITQPISVYTAGNSIYISSKTGAAPEGEVYIYNMIGQLIIQQKLSGHNITKISMNMSIGYYLVKVIAGENVYSAKVFVN